MPEFIEYLKVSFRRRYRNLTQGFCWYKTSEIQLTLSDERSRPADRLSSYNTSAKRQDVVETGTQIKRLERMGCNGQFANTLQDVLKYRPSFQVLFIYDRRSSCDEDFWFPRLHSLRSSEGYFSAFFFIFFYLQEFSFFFLYLFSF